MGDGHARNQDSKVVGEQQIYSQLRAVYASAEPAGTVGHTLDEVVEQSLQASNRIHNQTTLDTADASIISEAFAEAATALAGADPPTLVGRRALLIGVGSMGHLATAWLRRTGWPKSWCATVPTPAPPAAGGTMPGQGHTSAKSLSWTTWPPRSPPSTVRCCTSATDPILGVERLTDACRHSCGPLVGTERPAR